MQTNTSGPALCLGCSRHRLTFSASLETAASTNSVGTPTQRSREHNAIACAAELVFLIVAHHPTLEVPPHSKVMQQRETPPAKTHVQQNFKYYLRRKQTMYGTYHSCTTLSPFYNRNHSNMHHSYVQQTRLRLKTGVQILPDKRGQLCETVRRTVRAQTASVHHTGCLICIAHPPLWFRDGDDLETREDRGDSESSG